MCQVIRGGVLVGMTLILALFLTSVNMPKDVAFAQGTGTSLSISPPTQTVNAGDQFQVDIVVDTDTPTRGMKVGVDFDPTLVRVDSVTEGTFYSEGAEDIGNGASSFFNPGTIDYSSGTVRNAGVAILNAPS